MQLGNAQPYYADVDITVSESGLVTISGQTNHPGLQVQDSDNHTWKKRSYWTLNISIDERFDDFIYELHLPAGSKINYLRTPSLSRIESDGSGLSIIGTGKDQNFFLVVQYRIGQRSKSRFLIISILSIGISILALHAYVIHRKRHKKTKRYEEHNLTERQILILKIIKKEKKPITQAKIEKISRLPKSSLSRNIESLVRQGILRKESRGMSNVIFFSE